MSPIRIRCSPGRICQTLSARSVHLVHLPRRRGAGSAACGDLRAESLVGHLYLGRGNAFAANLPTYASGALDFSSSGMGIIQFGDNPTFTKATVIALVDKVVTGISAQAFLSTPGTSDNLVGF